MHEKSFEHANVCNFPMYSTIILLTSSEQSDPMHRTHSLYHNMHYNYINGTFLHNVNASEGQIRREGRGNIMTV